MEGSQVVVSRSDPGPVAMVIRDELFIQKPCQRNANWYWSVVRYYPQAQKLSLFWVHYVFLVSTHFITDHIRRDPDSAAYRDAAKQIERRPPVLTAFARTDHLRPAGGTCATPLC